MKLFWSRRSFHCSRSLKSTADDLRIGFRRPGQTEPLRMRPYKQHIFVCTGTSDWKPKISESPGLLGELICALEGEKDYIVTACDDRPYGNLELLVFPRRIRIINILSSQQIPIILRFLRNYGTERVDTQKLVKDYVFICSHGARDERCGYCGSILHQKFTEEAAIYYPKIEIRKCSHIGGHQYAGNVVTFGKGDWFGYVTPKDVHPILKYVNNSRLLLGDELKNIFRGRIGHGPDYL